MSPIAPRFLQPRCSLQATAWLAVALTGCAPRLPPPTPSPRDDWPSTFSVAGFDPATGDLGVAVQSKFFAVGAVVPWVEAGTGAIATQSYANTTYGPRGLALLREGKSPQAVVDELTAGDAEREFRQLGVVDAQGRTANFTGGRCIAWAGARAGPGFTAQGNLLVSEATIEAMAKAMQETGGELAERLVSALEAGQAAGGDARGRQSAALVVLRKNGGYGSFNDRYLDLRVDDAEDPIAELRRLLEAARGRDPISRARKLDQQDRREEALEVLRGAVARPGSPALARFELARLLLRDGKQEGQAELERALEASNGYDHAHYLAASILAEAGRAGEALKQVERTLVLNPQYAEVFRRELDRPASVFRSLGEPLQSLLRP